MPSETPVTEIAEQLVPLVQGERIVEAELPEVARTQAIAGREQQDGVVTTADADERSPFRRRVTSRPVEGIPVRASRRPRRLN